jgi:ubiquinone biosynthesis protein
VEGDKPSTATEQLNKQPMSKNGHPQSVVSRYEKVIAVLLKYGFEDMVAHPPFNRFVPKMPEWFSMRDGKMVTEFTRYERIRMACEELGTTFIKFAQIASNRPDILPEDLIAELERFQDHVNPVPKEDIKQVLEAEFKQPLDSIFKEINYTPIASASIAQVHKAKLKDGTTVVLKVQRPGIEDTIEADIKVLHQLAYIAEEYVTQLQSFQPMDLVKMFEKSIRKELKFTIEAGNLQRFRENFKGNDDIHVPLIFSKYTTDRVLCIEFIDGVKCTDLNAVAKIGLTGPELAVKGINLYFEQVFVHGFFHADPHPGNFFIMPNKKVCFIDYGMMGNIVDSDKEMLADLLLAIHDRDVQGLKKALLRFSTNENTINQKELEYDIMDFFNEYSAASIDEIEGEEFVKAINAMFFLYKIRIPANLLLLFKALVIIEGVGLTLDPKYNIIKSIEPFVRRLLTQKYSPQKLSQRLMKSMGDLTVLATNLPDDVQAVIKKLRQGKLHIEFEHKGLDEFNRNIERIFNRLSFTFIVVALIIGSSLLVMADIPPYFKGIPALGFFGFILAGILGLRLIISILRHGKF